jgi:hypothetical protein
MAEKKIDITAKEINGKVTTTEHKSSVSIKDIAANINKNKQYQTGKFDTKLKVTLKGFGEESLPNDAQFKRVSDFNFPTESFTFSFNKPLSTNFSNFDEISIAVTFGREFESVISNALEQATLSIQPLLVSQSVTNDQTVFAIGAGLRSETTNTKLVTFDVSKTLIEDPLIVENINKTLLKPFDDPFNASDESIIQVIFNRVFNELINATDDYCQICPDDDQTATFTKVVKEIQNPIELISKDVDKVLNDSYSVLETDPVFSIDVVKSNEVGVSLDLFTLTPKKVFSSEYSFSDFVTKEYQSNKLELINSQEILSFDIDKIFNNNLVSSSLISFTANKHLESSTTNTDTTEIVWHANLNLDTETISFDNQIFDISKSINLFSIPEESISKFLSTKLNTEFTNIDTVFPLFNKALSSSSLSQDELTALLFIEYRINNETQTTDSGLINNQSYFAEAYVEPGYVGTNRIIT